jgi:hypothetical protein
MKFSLHEINITEVFMAKNTIFKNLFLICALIFSTFFATFAFTAIQTFIRDYTYESDNYLDTKETCQAIALDQVKRLLLEELGTYVESSTIVKNYQLSNDQITTMTAGVVQTTVLDEKWDGKKYWIKASIATDPDEVTKSIGMARKVQRLESELKESQMIASKAQAEIKRMKAREKQSKSKSEDQKKYNKLVDQIKASNYFEQGTAYSVAGNKKAASQAFKKTIALRPNKALVIQKLENDLDKEWDKMQKGALDLKQKGDNLANIAKSGKKSPAEILAEALAIQAESEKVTKQGAQVSASAARLGEEKRKQRKAERDKRKAAFEKKINNMKKAGKSPAEIMAEFEKYNEADKKYEAQYKKEDEKFDKEIERKTEEYMRKMNSR